MKKAIAITLAAGMAFGADLPVTRVILYKNGVACYERAGEVKPGEPGRLDFKAGEMDDVLKSLSVSGPAVARVRYEMSETLQRKLAELPVQVGPQTALAVLLDQFRGARVELKLGGSTVAGTIVSGRLAALPNQGQRQELTLLADGGELRVIELEAASGVKLSDARLQQQLGEALLAVAQSRSKERRAMLVDTTAAGRLTARYLVPAPVWKSSYRLTLSEAAESTLEGWAIVDNASGEDWTNVDLTVVSGKPVSFVSRLYEPKYVARAEAALADDQPVAPVTYEGSLRRDEGKMMAAAPAPAPALAGRAMRMNAVGGIKAKAEMASDMAMPQESVMMMSSAAVNTVAREAGELFEYRFGSAVTAKKGESLLLPFLQQKLAVKRLLIYSDTTQANPRNAAEISNESGKTLDGGPITVYAAGGYAGEALMDTVKSGDKRLISYAVDQGVRVTTSFESGQAVVRTVKASKGILTAKSAVETTTTYSMDNVEGKEKTLVVEHPVDPGQTLLKPKADDTTARRYRFTVKLAPKAPAKLQVVQERVYEEAVAVSSLGVEQLFAYTNRKDLPAAAKAQLQALQTKRGEMNTVDAELQSIETQVNEINREQQRIRENINTLNRVAGQQEQVNRYAQELGRQDTSLVKLRDRQAELRKRRVGLDAELTALFEKLEF